MSRERIIENLRFSRREYLFHKTKVAGYPYKAQMIEYFAKECLKYRQMLKEC